ncbi:ABC transporter ATP-binding protein [Streptomyces profundus]|uniref:ABC transporter ATP-binding protein n=1 Tax=Streptomyces profundus TaxID=2867410 RepID=UPI002240F2F8|nr:ABC transporter ATP-binding protein [Streptomyces sp. MA3_2.13]UED83254.1 ABC transporter ATP-binding protein [Streptomyces sp. MA3_2.13]
MAEVQIRGLVKTFDGTVVVDRLDLTIADGEFVVLLGPSGCGKTTMLRCLAGLEHPTAGEITIAGELVSAPERGVFVPPEGRGTGMVFQSYALWPHMTVRGNVSYPLKLAKVPRREAAARAGAMLERVGLGDRGATYATQLSGGQQQRVALARALANAPRLLLFDEPLSNLDARLRLSMRKEIRSIHRDLGTTAIYVTHDQEEAMALADRIVVLDGGVVQQIGTPEEIYGSPANRFVADFMGVENLLDAAVGEVTADGYRLVGEGGGPSFPVRGAAPGPVGTRVTAAVRASQLRLADEGRAADDTFPATVTATSYLGGHTEIEVEAGGRRLLARLSENGRHRRGGVAPAPGESVRLYVVPDRVITLPTAPATRRAATTAA